MPPSGHPGVVTGTGCPLCDGPCRHPWEITAVPAGYPLLPEEMVRQMQPTDPAQDTDAPEFRIPRGRRRGENRVAAAEQATGTHPREDRSC